jgi:hypothetical protein
MEPSLGRDIMSTTKATPSTADDDESDEIPVSLANLRECLDSARYWIQFLPAYANGMQRRADTWAIMAGILAAIAGLSVWATVEQSTSAAARWVVVGVSLASAVCALLPRVKNYAEMAGHARELEARYGQVSGSLLDLWYEKKALTSQTGHEIINRFDAIKAAKDANLRDLPLKPSGKVSRDKDGVAEWPSDVYRRAKRKQPLVS